MAEDSTEVSLAVGDVYEPVAANHLIFMQHGLEGSTENFYGFVERFKVKYGEEVYIHLGIANEEHGYTSQGINVAGARLADEICKVHEGIFGSRKVKFTAIGHSLGGLLLRYAFGILYSQGKLTQMFDLQAFYSIASPHAGGIRRKDSGFVNFFANLVMSKILDLSGQQLLLNDECPEYDNRPLLVAMADPELPFYQALALFPRRVLYANVYHDLSVPYCTSAICHVNPYHKVKEMKAMEGYPHIVGERLDSPTIASLGQSDADPFDHSMELDISAQNNHGARLRQILGNLQRLDWQRYDCFFDMPPGAAHFLIINQPSFLPAGEDVPRHLLDNFQL